MKEVFTVLFIDNKQLKCVDFSFVDFENIQNIIKNKVITREELDDIKKLYEPVSDEYSKDVLDNLTIGYRYTDEVKNMIYDYLNSKPISEMEVYINQYFESKDAYLNTEGIKGINEYLMNKCPRIESKPILEKIINGGVNIYYFSQE